MLELGYVVVRFNQASGMPSLDSAGELYDTLAEAEYVRDACREQTARVGRGERYSIAEVSLIEETTDAR